MSTKNIIPRSSGEGEIGLENRPWSKANFNQGNFIESVVVGGQDIIEKINKISGALSGLEETPDVNSLSGALDSLSADVVTLSGSLADLEETPDVNSLSGALDSLSADVVTLSGSLANLEETPDVNSLSGALDSLSADVVTLSGSLVDLEETPDINSLSGALDSLNADVVTLSGSLADLEETPDVNSLSGALAQTGANLDADIQEISGAMAGIGIPKPNSVNSAAIINGAVTADKITDGAIPGSKITNGSITSAKILAGSIGSSHILDGTISTIDIANKSITSEKLENSITIAQDLSVAGDLFVSGSTVTVDASTIVVEDKNIEIGSTDNPTDITADGGGITLKGDTDKTILWSGAKDAWAFNTDVIGTGVGGRLTHEGLSYLVSGDASDSSASFTDLSDTPSSLDPGTTLKVGVSGEIFLAAEREIVSYSSVGTPGYGTLVESVFDGNPASNISISSTDTVHENIDISLLELEAGDQLEFLMWRNTSSLYPTLNGSDLVFAGSVGGSAETWVSASAIAGTNVLSLRVASTVVGSDGITLRAIKLNGSDLGPTRIKPAQSTSDTVNDISNHGITSLSDTPSAHEAGAYLRVNAAGSAIEHIQSGPLSGGLGDSSKVQSLSNFSGKLPDQIILKHKNPAAGEENAFVFTLRTIGTTSIDYFDEYGEGPYRISFNNDGTGTFLDNSGTSYLEFYEGVEPSLQDIIDGGNAIFLGRMSGGSSKWSENAGNIGYTSGNVGIGTTSPNTVLHVTSPVGNGDGTVFIENTLADYGMGLKVKGGGNVDDERFALKVQNAAGDDILFAQSKTGNVGIGTTSPGRLLSVEDSSSNAFISIVSKNDSRSAILLGDTDSDSQGRIDYDNSDDHLHFSTSATERMRIDSSGNVGIGTASPDAITHLSPASGIKGLRIDVPNGSTAPATQIRYNDSTKIQLSANGNSYFNGGNVGIGTTSPSKLLDVKGGGGATVEQYLRNDTVNLLSKILTTNQAQFGTETSHPLVFLAGNAECMRIQPTGNVGIGTTSPSSKFHVKGLFGGPDTTGSSNNGIARFGQASGAGVLDIGFGDPYSWLQSRASNDYSTNYGLSLQPNGGNVGIGTTTPAGTLELSSTATDVNLYMGGTPVSGGREPWRFQSEGDYLYIGQNKSSFAQYMTFHGSSVGIGTTTPSQKLHVYGTTLLESANAKLCVCANGKIEIQATVEVDDDGGTKGLWFGDIGESQPKGYIGGGAYAVNGLGTNDFGISSSAGNNLAFGIGGVEKMRIRANGTVEIPGNLVVTGTTTTNNVETVSTSNGVVFEGSVTDDHEGTLKAVTLTADRAYTLPNQSGTVAMTSDIKNSAITITAGNALTGGGVLNLNQSSAETITLNHQDTSSQGSSNNSGRTYIQDITLDTYGHVTGIGTATETVINTDTNTTYTAGNHLTLTGTEFSVNRDLRGGTDPSTGVYAIGQNDQSYFMVHGIFSKKAETYLGGNLISKLEEDGDLHIEGDVVAFSTTVSDEKFKDNIGQIKGGLEKVKKLRGVEFDWNATSRKGTKDIGVIAQEVEEVIPEVVSEKVPCVGEFCENTEKYKTVDYSKLVPVLIEAIKDLSEEVEELKKKLS